VHDDTRTTRLPQVRSGSQDTSGPLRAATPWWSGQGAEGFAHVNRYERLNRVLGLLADNGHIEVDVAADLLRVSPATIRRDLDHLASQQMLTRTRGGAVAHNVSYDLPLRYKAGRQTSSKQRIGRAAAALVRPGMVVGLNGGTTTTELARALATRPDMQDVDDPAITVVTNALNIANELAVRRNVKIVLTGGVARPQSFELFGPLAERVLADVHVDMAFLGVEGIDAKDGAYTRHEGEASVNRLLAGRATSVAVVTDSTKLGQRTFAHIWPTRDVATLITDTDADPEQVAAFTAAGVHVMQV
jgi:DeoR family transcriptional regulator, aga operon transcriptional repressor